VTRTGRAAGQGSAAASGHRGGAPRPLE